MAEQKNIWIFGYGSLMWNPGFEYLDTQIATLTGYHRDMCILSYVFRGTPETPGLVMGLQPGGACLGRAYKVAGANVDTVMAYLYEREMINNVYEPVWHPIQLDNGEEVSAFTFVSVKGHPQYAGDFSKQKKIRYLRQGTGQMGTAIEYLENTCCHLRDLDIFDPSLEELLRTSRDQTV